MAEIHESDGGNNFGLFRSFPSISILLWNLVLFSRLTILIVVNQQFSERQIIRRDQKIA
jgi:hypothetical protein